VIDLLSALLQLRAAGTELASWASWRLDVNNLCGIFAKMAVATLDSGVIIIPKKRS
jgi:hypothetical protein